jgi:hypothetical protein
VPASWRGCEGRGRQLALQDCGHGGAGAVGIHGVDDGLPLSGDGAGKQFQHAALQSDDTHVVQGAFPRAGQDENTSRSGEAPLLRGLGEVDDALPASRRQRRVHRVKVQAAEQH